MKQPNAPSSFSILLLRSELLVRKRKQSWHRVRKWVAKRGGFLQRRSIGQKNTGRVQNVAAGGVVLRALLTKHSSPHQSTPRLVKVRVHTNPIVTLLTYPRVSPRVGLSCPKLLLCKVSPRERRFEYFQLLSPMPDLRMSRVPDVRRLVLLVVQFSRGCPQRRDCVRARAGMASDGTFPAGMLPPAAMPVSSSVIYCLSGVGNVALCY